MKFQDLEPGYELAYLRYELDHFRSVDGGTGADKCWSNQPHSSIKIFFKPVETFWETFAGGLEEYFYYCPKRDCHKFVRYCNYIKENFISVKKE